MTEEIVRSRPKQISLWAALILVTWIAIEGLAVLFYKPITGAGFSDASIEATDNAESPDLRPGREQAGLGMRDPNMVIHPYFGYVFRPRPDDAEPSRIAISKDGFLDDQPAVRKRRPGVALVGILGGSVSGQLGSFHSDKLRSALADIFPARTIEFIRLGMPGYHQPQQVQQLTYILAQGGEFDLLLNIDGFNEVAVPVALNAPQGAHPLFPMNWSMVALDVPDPAIRRTMGEIAYLQDLRREELASFRASLPSRSALARLFWKRKDQALAAKVARAQWELQQFPIDEIPYFVRGPETWHELDDGLVEACVDVWARSSRQLHALCQAHDIRYVHVLQPNQYVPGSKPLSSEEETNAYDAAGPYRPVVEEGYPLMAAAGDDLAREGVEFLDLTFVFAETRETVYVDNCCHFNGYGNELMCQAIGQAMKDSR